MPSFHLLTILFVTMQVATVKAQSFDRLNSLPGHSVQLYYSNGYEQRAAGIALRVDNAFDYYHQLLDFKPVVNMLVLSPDDWSQYTSFPVYGMPHYNNDKTLIVAASDNAFWKSFIPPMEQLPEVLRTSIQKVYTNDAGNISMQAFFDLLALHELGHAFHFQGKLNMQRKWLGELFVNVLLHTYIAEKEPEALPALTLFPNMVVNAGSKEFTYTSLHDIEERYDEIGKQFPKNYGWYQCRWHIAAGTIYDAAGKQVCRKLWDAFKMNKEKSDDARLTALLSGVHMAVADVMINWDRDTTR